MLRGIPIAERLLSKERLLAYPPMVYFDPDIDGLVAGYFIVNYLAGKGIPYSYYVNPNRTHGFLIDPRRVKGLTVINGDFAVTREETEKILAAGANLVSLDHHDNGEDFIHVVDGDLEGVTINNQYPFEDPKNRYQSGAQVTWEVLKELDPSLDNKTNRALVGLTLLSDVRDIENSRARSFLRELYGHPYKGYIKYLIDQTLPKVDWSFGVPRLDRNYVDYTLSPAVNSMFRLGAEDKAVDFILGHGYPDFDYRTEQKALVARMLKIAVTREHKRIIFFELNALHFSAEDRLHLSSFIGLVASKLTDKYGKNAIGWVKTEQGQYGRASFRGTQDGVRYRSALSRYIDAAGHEIAFGIRNFHPTSKLLLLLDESAVQAEGSYSNTPAYVEVANLSKYASFEGRRLAAENTYLMSHNKVHVKYTGSKLTVITLLDRPDYQRYHVDGVEVVGFSRDLHPARDLMLPVQERDSVKWYVQKKFDPEAS